MKAKGVTPANDKWKQKYVEPVGPDASKQGELPEGWIWASVEQLCFVDTGATPKRGTERYFKNGTIDWITSTAVNEPLIRVAAERITSLAIQETNAKVFPRGSLIVAMYGEGKTRGKVSELGIEAATNQACAALICGHLGAGIKTHLRNFLESNYLALRAQAAGGVQPNLNLSIVKGIALPLPPTSEIDTVNEIAAIRLSQATAFASGLPSSHRQSAALRQRILSHAFSGALVPQDPTDEPAAILLARIAAERDAALSKSSRGPKRKHEV